MPGKIICSYLYKIIFSFLYDDDILPIIKYNKKLQNILDINIIDYKTFSGKYILMENNDIGKEYDIINSKLIRKGKYINGKWIGKVKEYYLNGKLEFEGEYLFNKRWNGKIYDIKNNNYYELINGKGFIKEYDYDGTLRFEGEYLNGERNGKGKEYDYD